MLTVCFEACLSNEWKTTEASHIEALSPKISQLPIQTVVMVINFVNADAAREQGIFRFAAKRQYSLIDLSECIRCELGFRKVSDKLSHAFPAD